MPINVPPQQLRLRPRGTQITPAPRRRKADAPGFTIRREQSGSIAFGLTRPGIEHLPRPVRDLCAELPGAVFSRGEWWFPGDAASLLADLGINVPDAAPVAPARPLSALRPYQEAAVKYHLARRGSLCALPMGLGKTLTAIATARSLPLDLGARVVVCPNVVKGVWADEITKWHVKGTPAPKVLVLRGGASEEWLATRHRWQGSLVAGHEALREADWIVLNYQVAAAWAKPILTRRKCGLLVCDEAHMLSNRRAQRTEALFGRPADPMEHRFYYAPTMKLGLSGTPLPNDTSDPYSVLSFLNPGWYGSFWKYAQRYCITTRNAYGWKVERGVNPDHQAELAARFSEVMFQVSDQDANLGLPPATRQVIRVELDDDTKAAALPLRTLHGMSRDPTASVGSWGEALRAAGRLKVPHTVAFVASCSARKPVVFAWTRESVAAIARGLRRHFEYVYTATGADSDAARYARSKEFNADPRRVVFVATMGSMPLGISLAGGDAVVFNDLLWSPDDLRQLERRVARPGGPAWKQTTAIVYLAAKDTIDAMCASYCVEKMDTQAVTLIASEQRQGLTEALTQPGPNDEDFTILRGRLAEWASAREEEWDVYV